MPIFRSLSTRITSCIIQFEAALGSLTWRATASKKSAIARSAVSTPASYSGRP